MVDRMNSSAANKLLKLIEEPPQNTVLLMIAEDEGLLLGTLKSRCQILQFPPLPESVVVDGLIQQGASREEANQIAQEANGNFNKALDLMLQDSEDMIFEKWFAQWARSAFKAKGNRAAIHELILWSDEISRTGRETQKKFLSFCLSLIRQAMLLNYNTPSLVYIRMHESDFDLQRFASFIHENNVREMVQEFESARYHILRNGNSKIIFTDLSIKLTRLIHTKPTQKITP
jgi:DNA polymerase-3 subunit delta'